MCSTGKTTCATRRGNLRRCAASWTPCMSGARAACPGARRVAPWPACPPVWARCTGDRGAEGPHQVRGPPRSRRGRPYAGASRDSHVAGASRTPARAPERGDDVAQLDFYSV
jgi:hypothetical protein